MIREWSFLIKSSKRYNLTMKRTISAFLPAAFMLLLAMAPSACQAAGHPPEGAAIGDRIAWWAESFVGRPYDPDPLGEYVRKNVIVADERVDCMYLTFRAVELAMSSTPDEAVNQALTLRFITKGVIKDGLVQNYDERFQYATDMIDSGRWGTEVTASLGAPTELPGTRGHKTISILGREAAVRSAPLLQNGDLVFFIKKPEKRVVGEMVGHLGFVSRSGADVFLIHASGNKNGAGSVKKVSLPDYLENMPFAGIRVMRFAQ